MVTTAAGLVSDATGHDDRRRARQVAAFIDFDGTLAAGFTGALLPWDRLRRREMGITELVEIVWVAFNHSLGRRDFNDFIRLGSLPLRGRHVDDLTEIGQRLYTTSIQSRIYPEMTKIVADHLAQGHVVVITSAAFHLQVEPVARALGITEILCNRCEIDDDGVLTGEVVKPVVRGRGKAEAVTAYAAANDIDLAESYFYADGDEDIPVMTLVGNPRPTNPARGLLQLARQQDWQVLRFTSRSGNLPVARARMGLATLAAMPLGVVALGAATLRLNHRRGYELFAAHWPRLVLDLAGVVLNVTGAQHIDPTKPAMYLINHRSTADLIIVGALLGRPLEALPGLHTDPVVATVRRLFGLPEGDTDGRHRDRMSLVAAAEGAMQAAPEIASFDERPFRRAKQAGLPVVPIVIRNVDVIAGPQSPVLHPGTLDVAVLEPVSLRQWTETGMAAGIAEIRHKYIRTLENQFGSA